MSLRILLISYIIILVPPVGLARAATIHVPGDYPTIQAGINAASGGDTVLVADGTYTGTGNVNLDFGIRAITVRSENGPENCIIDCRNASDTRGFHFHRYEDQRSIVDGFTIQNGNSDQGGGILCDSGTAPTIRNNIIMGNFAGVGGGISCYQSSPEITNNIIKENRAGLTGGGIFCWTSGAKIISNIITGNTADDYGGAIHCHYGSYPTIINNTITGNSSRYGGGALYCDWNSFAEVTNTILWDNAPQEIYYGFGDTMSFPNVVTISYSDVQGGRDGIATYNAGFVHWRTGNIDADPCFIADYHLRHDSPCIGAGTVTQDMPTTDIEGNPRPNPIGTDPDIGACESGRAVPSGSNSPPIAYDRTVTTDENTPAAITLTGSDPDGDLLTYTITNDPSNGILTGTPPNVIYAPNPGFDGNDSFTFEVSDGVVDSDDAIVTITVNPGNEAPVAMNDTYDMNEDDTLSVSTPGVLNNDSDPDGDVLTAVLVDDVSNGTLSLNADGSFSYTPDSNYNGTDSFTYKANDGGFDSNTATVSITVNRINDPLEITSTPPTQAIEGAPYTYNAEVTDPDEDDEVTYSLTTSPDGMTIDEDTGEIEWTPANEQVGNNDVVVQVRDSAGATDTQSFTITVEPTDLAVEAFSPVDLVVTDPKGRTIDKYGSTIPCATYIEEKDPGYDKVVICDALVGDYSIEVVRETEAASTDTYTLDVSYSGETTTLADDRLVPVQTESYDFFFPQSEMEQGWNLISVPIKLPNNSIDAALQSIMPGCSSVWTYEATDTGGEWKRYVRNAPKFLNTLETIDAGKGYWVLMDDFSILTLDEDEVATQPISLKPRWNLVGYNCLKARPIGEVLPPYYSSVWTYDAREGGWKRHIAGRSDNSLEMMEPGKGYWVDAIAGFDWNVSGSVVTAPASPPVAAELGMVGLMNQAITKADVPIDRPGIPCIIWGSVEDNGVKMTGRGTARRAPMVILKVDDEVQSSYQLGTVAQYGDYYVLDMDVPENHRRPDKSGNYSSSAQVELYVQTEDTIARAASIPPGRPGETMRLDLYVRLIPRVSLLYQNYPNPCNPDTWIPYRLKEDADVVIGIYTLTGQLIRTLNLGHKSAGFYTDKEKAAYWDGKNETGEQVASGVYFYSIKAGDYSAAKKMTIVR